MCADRAPAPREVPKAKRKSPPPVVIAAELNRAHAYPGDQMRLTELVPLSREIKVRSIWHSVHIIGQYDFTTNTLVNRAPEKALYSGMHVFDQCDWSGGLIATGNKFFPFEVTNPRQEGIEFSFKARELGIFLIKAEWTLYRSDDVIESNPVILIVSPPLDKDGKPIIKESWIDPIDWKYRPR